MGLVKTGRRGRSPRPTRLCGSSSALRFSKCPRKDPFRRRPHHCSLRHILQYVKRRAMAVIGSVANVGVLPVPMLPISNWGLRLAHVGSQNEVPQEAGDLV